MPLAVVTWVDRDDDLFFRRETASTQQTVRSNLREPPLVLTLIISDTR